MKEFMFDYHNRNGFLGRWWVEAKDLEEAKEKAKNTLSRTAKINDFLSNPTKEVIP